MTAHIYPVCTVCTMCACGGQGSGSRFPPSTVWVPSLGSKLLYIFRVPDCFMRAIGAMPLILQGHYPCKSEVGHSPIPALKRLRQEVSKFTASASCTAVPGRLATRWDLSQESKVIMITIVVTLWFWAPEGTSAGMYFAVRNLGAEQQWTWSQTPDLESIIWIHVSNLSQDLLSDKLTFLSHSLFL